MRYAVLGVTLSVLAAGCGSSDSTPGLVQSLADATVALAETLENVNEAESAQAAIPELRAQFDDLIKQLREFPDAVPEGAGSFPREEMSKLLFASTRLRSARIRAGQLPDLPIEFWRVVRVKSFLVGSATLALLDALGKQPDADRQRFLSGYAKMLERYGHDKVVSLNLQYTFSEENAIVPGVVERIKRICPAAVTDVRKDRFQSEIVVAPVDDYQAFLAAIDFGKMTAKRDSMRAITVSLNEPIEASKARRAPHESPAVASNPASPPTRRDFPPTNPFEGFAFEPSKPDDAEAFGTPPGATSKPSSPPSAPSVVPDARVLEQLLADMESDSPFRRQAALARIQSLNVEKLSPGDVEKLARAFAELIENTHFDDKKRAIRDLSKLKGDAGVKVLIGMLDDRRGFQNEDIFRALGEMKNPIAAVPVARHLGNFFNHKYARRCLLDMGTAAEDGLIAVAPSNNADVCLAAIEILGEVGTKKCLPTLRQAASSSRNVAVRDAARMSIQMVMARTKDEKPPASK